MNTWTIDQGHSTIGFSVKHLVISTVKGKFTNFAGTVTTADDTFENAQAELTIHSNSIDTNQADRDAHLRGADMFDSEAFPEITFTSESFVKKGDEFEVVGTITIKGVSKTVTLQGTLGGIVMGMYGKRIAAFELSGKLNRMDFGVSWNALLETGGMVVSEEVKLDIQLELIEA
jgi:polyisoprenoid-binding protein YceI